MPKKLKPDRPNEAKDAPPEWREAIRNRAIQQEVSEDNIIKFGLYYEFKVQKEINEVREAQKESKELMKQLVDAVKDLTKEMKKK